MDETGSSMKLEELTVTGMTCASCSARVEKVVGKLAGVKLASVNLATERLRLEYDEARLSLDAVRGAVEGAGYGLAAQETLKRVTIPIGGMTCASCSARIEKVVGRLDGVAEVSVNLATEKADVSYDPARVRLSAIKKTITDAGYTPREIDASDAVDKDAERKAREIRTMWTKFIVAAAVAVPLLYLAMGHMLPGVRFPLPWFLDPMQYPLVYALVADRPGHPRDRRGQPVLPGRRKGALAPGAEHGFADRHRHRGGGSLQPVLDLADRHRGLRRGGATCTSRPRRSSSPSSCSARPWRPCPRARPPRPSRSSWASRRRPRS